jgi:hypothetical protein
MSSNHPDQNAEGGKFTGKVKHSGPSVLTVEYWKAKQTLPGRFPNRPRVKRLTGSEQEMRPKSESTRLEGPNGLEEYRGSEKLKNKKAIITGGE